MAMRGLLRGCHECERWGEERARLRQEVARLGDELATERDQRLSARIRERQASRLMLYPRPDAEPNDDDVVWEWGPALAFAERMLLEEMVQFGAEARATGQAVHTSIDLAAIRLTANRLASLEVEYAERRACMLAEFADELDDLFAGNAVSEHLRADDPAGVARW